MTSATRTLDDLLSLHSLLPGAWSAAERAGAFLRDDRPADLVIDTKSTPSDVVSAMDRDAEAMIIADLLGPRPDDGLLGEEGGERLGTSGVRWVEVGVVHLPALGEAYLAVRGQGSWLVRDGIGERLVRSDCRTLASAIVATGFGYSAARRGRQAEVVRGLIVEASDIRRLGAAVVDYCWMARGNLDAYYEAGLNPWDRAAGELIAQEAGIVVTGLHDDDASGFFVAAVPAILDDLRRTLVDLRADEV